MVNEMIGHLEEEARKRRERLKALREQSKASDDVPNKKEKLDLPKPELKLRNYVPIDDELKKSKLEDAKPGDVEGHIQVNVN